MKELTDYLNANKSDADEIKKVLMIEDRFVQLPHAVSTTFKDSENPRTSNLCNLDEDLLRKEKSLETIKK